MSAQAASTETGSRAPGSARRRWRSAAVLLGAAAVLAVLLMGGSAGAQEDDDQRFDNAYCLGCHAGDGMQTALPSGDVLDLTVDPEVWSESLHGRYEIPCALCHTDITPYPHDPIPEADYRTYQIAKNAACGDCHEAEATAAADNVHAEAAAAGMPEAAVCTDCHGAHDTVRPVAHSPEVPLTCRNCHSEIYDLYAESIHGAALTQGNRDVPTCTDCHGVHDVEGPSKPQFHLFSPQICAECHEDEELMAQYGISTEVFDTYVADFHGTTVTLFEDLAPDQETNKPVCVDCHGIHAIQSADDPESSTYRANLLATCQRCHPDAADDFPDSWLSHYTPEPGKATVVWVVQSFYKIIIPLVIGGMLLYVIIAVTRRRSHSAEEGDRG